jgi:hypothetical protein
LDPRFRDAYRLASRIRHTLGGYWCIFEKIDVKPGANEQVRATR